MPLAGAGVGQSPAAAVQLWEALCHANVDSCSVGARRLRQSQCWGRELAQDSSGTELCSSCAAEILLSKCLLEMDVAGVQGGDYKPV